MKRLSVLITILVTLALLLACAPKAEPTPTPAPPSEQPKYGGVIHYPLPYLPKGFDAHRKVSRSPYVSMLIFNNLVKMDPLVAKVDPQYIVPDLAERWEVSADVKTYTFYLRQGVKWHDGMPFTADDVIYSLEKMQDKERCSVTSYVKAIGSIEKVSDHVVKVNMDSADPSFLHMMTGGYTPIQPKHKADVDWRTSDFLVGTGPFKFKSMVSTVELEVERNPDYFKKDAAGNQLPYLDGVKIHVIENRSAQFDAIATKKLDMTNPGMAVYTAEHLEQINRTAPGIEVAWTKKPYSTILWINHNHKPFDDIRVRKAIAYLSMPEEIVIASYGSKEWGSYPGGMLPPAFGLPAKEINKIFEYRTWPLEKRVKEAKKLLAKAGYAEGLPINFTADETEGSTRRVLYLTDQYNRYLNADAEAKIYDRARIDDIVDGGNFDLYCKDRALFMAEPNEARGYFQTGTEKNPGGISIPEADKLWDQQAAELDIEKRKQLTRKIERLYLENFAVVPGAFQVSVQVWWPYVKGYKPIAESYQSNVAFEYVWLDK